MNVEISRNAAKVLREEIDNPENEGKFLGVTITHSDGDGRPLRDENGRRVRERRNH